MNPLFSDAVIAAATNEFFTPTNIVSVAVATAAVNVTANTLFALFKAPKKITAFAAAIVIAYLAVYMQKSPEPYEWVFAFFNACLLFCSAFGLNELAAGQAQGFARAGFFQSWIRE